MARYIATSGSYFEPFTYEQLAAPVQQATEAVNTTADAYDQMNLEASALEEYLQREPNDSRAREMYNTYMNQLGALQDELWNNGYSAAARRNLTAARQGYASNIVRLQKAITDRQARSKEYWDTAHKNPDMVMGFDPGAANLDKYLENDLYGQDYYSYSGNDFMNAVGADAKARVSELLRDPKYQKDVPGYITRFMTSGATSAEVEGAKQIVDAVLSGTMSRESLEANNSVEAILASTLLSHLDSSGASTGKNGNISKEQFDRLVNYGKAGLSQAIGKTEPKDLEDVIFNSNLEFESWKKKQDYSAKLAAEAAATKKQEEEDQKIRDRRTDNFVNPDSVKAVDKLKKDLDSDKAYNITTKKGVHVTSAAQASDLVYSGDLRREYYDILGFDLGRTPTTVGLFNGSEDFIGGSVVGADGKTYETRFNPHAKLDGRKGTVEYRQGNGQWYIDRRLTDKYWEGRKKYEEVLEYAKKNEKDLYNAASINPDKQYEIYSRDRSVFSIPLTEYEAEMTSKNPAYSPQTITSTYVGRFGVDSGEYAQRFADVLSSSIEKDKKGNPTKTKGWRSYNGQTSFIHPMTDFGTVDEKAMKNPEDVFVFNKGKDDPGSINRITNVNGVRVDANAILNNYIILERSNGGPIAVGIGMFHSDQLTTAYDTAKQQLARLQSDPMINNSNISEEEREEYKEYFVRLIVDRLAASLQDSFGYDMNTQKQGGTKQDNNN